MRFRRRYLVLACATVAALTVGGTAVANHGPGNNTGVKCTPSVTVCQDNTSALPTWAMRLPANNSNDLPGSGGAGNGGSGPTVPVKLDVQTASYYAHPNQPIQGGKIAQVTLDFDNDVVFAANLGGAGVPSCTAAAQQGGGAQATVWSSGTTIQEAWEDCGPGSDDGAGPEVNAFLSPGNTYSGTISTAPAANFPGCNLVFKRSSTSVTLFARATAIVNGGNQCVGSPANNTGGNTTVILAGALSTLTTVPDYRTRLSVGIPSSIPLALDNFRSTVSRGGVVQGRCRDTNKLNNLRGVFKYHGNQTEQPQDVVARTHACL